MKHMFNKLVTHCGRYKVGALSAVFLALYLLCRQIELTPIEGERLSDWMLRQPSSSLSYSTGLQWQVPSQRDAQAKLKRNVLDELNASQNVVVGC
jgi:hypothetical protein